MAGNQNLITRLIFEAEDRASGVITKIGTAMATWFAVDKISGFFGSAVKGAADLEKQFSTLQAATNATDEAVASLKAKAEELGASDKLAVSAVQAAEAMTELGRAGQSSAQILESITPVMALAQGASLELGQAAGIVAANLAGFQLAADQSGRVADVLSTAASSAKTTVAQLADALSYAAPAANAAGMSIEEVTAIIAKMQNAGIDGSRAGTALNAMLASLADPASTASKALDAAGISTRDFAQVLAELEKGGPAAQKAINGFGTEAGPALKALLAQGSASVRELQSVLNQASGSAEKAAATMNDNLAGAFEAVGSVWEGLKTALVQPLLEPIERQARSLAATLADFSKSAQMEQLKQVLVTTFETGVAQIKAFAGAVDWPKFAQSVSDALAGMLESLKTWAANLGTVRDTAILAFSSIGTGIATLQSAFFGLAGVVSTVVEKIIQGFAAIIKAQSNLTFGPLRTAMQRVSQELNDVAESFAASAEVNFGKAQAALDVAAERAETLRGAWDRLNAPAQAVAASTRDLTAAQEQGTEQAQALIDAEQALTQALNDYDAALVRVQSGQEDAGTSLVDLGKSVTDARARLAELQAGAESVAPALGKVADAAKDTRTPVEQATQQINALEIAYRAFLSVGDLQGAARIRSQIEGIKESLKGAAGQAGITTEAVASAFRALGIESQSALQETAERARESFETIRDSGTSTPADIQAAFVSYAEKAIAANNGVADSALKAQAEQLGIGIKATEAGDQVVAATGKQIGIIGQLATMRDKAAKAAEQEFKLIESGAKTIEHEGSMRVAHLQTLQKEAEARGEVQAAAQIGVQILQAEADVLYQNAAAQQAVADAAARVLETKIKAAQADGEISEQEREAIERARDLAEAKQREADVTREAADAKQADADAADKQAESTDKVRTATQSWSSVMRTAGVDVESLGKYAQVAEEAFAKTYNALVKVAGVQFGDQKYLMYAKEAAESAAAHARAVDQLAAYQDNLNAQLDAGTIGLAGYIEAMQRGANATGRLSREDLAGVRAAIADAKSRMDDFADSAQDGLRSLQQEWAELNGQQIQAAIIEQQIERLKLETELAQAKKDGNREAIAALEQQLILMDQIHAKQLQMLAEEEAARAIQAAEDAAREAERRAGLSAEARQHEDAINSLKAQLAAAIKAQDEALKASILAQIAAENERHKQAMANLEKEQKAKADAAKKPPGEKRDPSDGGTQPIAGAPVAPVRVVNVNIAAPRDQGTVRVLEGDDAVLERLLKSLETGKTVYQ